VLPTTGDGTQRGRRIVRWGVAVSVAAAVFVFAGLGAAATSFSDASGDNNEAPDVTSVKVAETPLGTISVSVAVANYESLPADSWFNLWFDLDSNAATGDEGDEALVRYLSGGRLESFRWNGSELVAQPTTGMTSSFAAGVLTLAIPKAALADAGTFGVLAVASRSQVLGEDEFVASDYAPDLGLGRSAYVAPVEMAFVDAGGDHDAAPDVTSVNVTDAKSGWISIAISTPNYAELPLDTGLVVRIDRDNRASTGDGGADILITAGGGEVLLERWDPVVKTWIPDVPPTRARMRNSRNVITLELHRGELENTPRFGFSMAAIKVNVDAQLVLGVDFAPDGDGFYRYALANRPALLLTATRLFATPARPKAGKPFTVNLGVRRSDTSRGITTGTVACRVLVDAKRVLATGKVAGGNGRCSFVVPKTASGSTLRGTITVRTGGKSVTAGFSYVVR
jgi:hypothetical protein